MGGAPIAPVAARLGEGIRCLAFDEMVVANTADAAIMSRLFTALIRDEGVSVVTTSNRPPRDLYKDGLNRSLFLPFIDLVLAEMDVLPLNGPTDYRLDRLGDLDTWHTPLGEEATAQVRDLVNTPAGDHGPAALPPRRPFPRAIDVTLAALFQHFARHCDPRPRTIKSAQNRGTSWAWPIRRRRSSRDGTDNRPRNRD